jgi:hypothetical protein
MTSFPKQWFGYNGLGYVCLFIKQEPAGSDSMYDSDFNDTGSETAGERPMSAEEKERPDSTEVDGEWGEIKKCST